MPHLARPTHRTLDQPVLNADGWPRDVSGGALLVWLLGIGTGLLAAAAL